MATAQKAANKTAETKAAPQSSAIAVSLSGAMILKDAPAGFKVKRAVTLPSLSIKAGTAYYLKLMDALRVSSVMDKPKDGSKPRDPATICTATDVSTGQQYTYLCNSVVKENLNRDYPNDTYIGKIFRIENMGKRQENQRYFDFSILEVEAE